MTFVHHITRTIVVFVAVLAVACSGNKKEAMVTAKAFLQAYYVDLDFNTALQLCINASKEAINNQAERISLNPYAKEEIPDIVINYIEIEPENSTFANCIYTCNRIKRKLPLRNLNGKWLVDLGNGTVENTENSDFVQLSQGGNNGFASATSGEIKYKKCRQGKFN